MTPVKTCFLLLLSVLFIAPTVSEVVTSMSDCEGFLLNNKPPQIPDVVEDDKIQDNNRYKVICQTYKNVRRFVTLYDTKNRIPVFSAYKFTGARKRQRQYDNIKTKNTREKTWTTEPQLEDNDKDKNNMCQKQACNFDYKNSGYDKGHLFPCSHLKNQDDNISTFTLTNAVPQNITLNRGHWRTMENSVKFIIEKDCINNNGVIESYVITGAKPSDKNTINNRVNVPSLLWSAFCCYSENLQKWIASAYWADNGPNRPKQPLPLETLTELYNKINIKAFPESMCPLP